MKNLKYLLIIILFHSCNGQESKGTVTYPKSKEMSTEHFNVNGFKNYQTEQEKVSSLNATEKVTIGLVGKYVELADSYKSIIEALVHASTYNDRKADIILIHSEAITPENVSEKLEGLDGILVAPGFGHRGIEGKLYATKYAREKNIPFFGICLGMQMSVIEYARNVLNYEDANSTEMNHSTTHPVIDIMEAQKDVTEKGGTMRLGAYECQVKKGTKAFEAYKTELVRERHRHRYEFNNDYLKTFEQAGMSATGINPETGLVEIVEIPTHKWFVGVQFHPEYSSTVLKPHPIFMAFIKAAIDHQ